MIIILWHVRAGVLTVYMKLNGRDQAKGQVTLFSETDKHGTITFANEAFCEVSKYSREELIGKPHNIIRHPDMPKRLFEIWWDTIGSGRVFRAVVKNRAKDGSHYWVEAAIMPVLNNNGEVIGFLGARHLIPDEGLAREMYREQVMKWNLPVLEEKAVAS